MIAAGFILSMAFYDKLPESMASHWNGKGQVDGYMSKSVCAFLMPGIMAVIAATFMLIVRIDPLKANVEKFRSYYEGFILFQTAFLLVLHIWMLLWNTGVKVSANFIMPLTVGGLYFFLGMILGKIKRNWFIGVKTPWTLSNDTVWKKTHEFSGPLFKVAGLIAMAGALFAQVAIWFVLVPILAVSVIITIYSYVIYKKIEAGGIDGDAAEMKIDAGSGDSTWDNLKEGYLQQVEKSLMKVSSPRKKEVLEDIACHLDQKFGELADDDRTWENYQQIITEMGPAGDYAELLSPASVEASTKKFPLGMIIKVVVIAGLIWLMLPFINKAIRKAGFDTRQVDNINLPFVNDPEVIGTWTSVDFVREMEQFKAGEKQWGGGELYLKELIFLPEGKTFKPWWNWTRGVVTHSGDKTAAKYHIQEFDGDTYMFFEWKSGDYTIRHMKPAYYVLKKEIAVIDVEVIETTKDFLPGDSIEITEILGTTGKIETGRTYTIKGKYKLVSQDKAKLHLYATNGETTCKQGPVVNKGQGEFTRTFTYQKEGWPHLSFYPAEGGSSFGNLYFNNKGGYLPDIQQIMGVASKIGTVRAKTAAGAVDVAIDDVRLQPYAEGGLWQVIVAIGNKGEAASGKFGVHFYHNDPDKKKPMTHGAGPIESDKVWNECSMPFGLKEGVNEIVVVIDPKDAVKETDETNNEAILTVVVKDRKIVDKKMTSRSTSKTVNPPMKYIDERGYRVRRFVRIVSGKDEITFQGQKTSLEELAGLLEQVPDRDITVLEVGFAEMPRKPKEIKNHMQWLSKNPVWRKAAELREEFGFEYLSFVGKHKLGVVSGGTRNYLVRAMKFGEEIEVNLPSAEETPLVYLRTIEFTKNKAFLQATVTSHPKTKWDIEIAFFDENMKRLDYVFKNYENSGIIFGVAANSKETIEVGISKMKNLEKAKFFELSIKQSEKRD